MTARLTTHPLFWSFVHNPYGLKEFLVATSILCEARDEFNVKNCWFENNIKALTIDLIVYFKENKIQTTISNHEERIVFCASY